MKDEKNNYTVENKLPLASLFRNNIVIPIISQKPKPWPKLADKIDTWLDSIGLYRKHVARDTSSLFRCVSEHVYLTQVYHTKVRKQCIDFVINNPDIFRTLTTCPSKEYIERLQNSKESGNILDIKIMSLIYGYDFMMYTDVEKEPEKITDNNFNKIITLSVTNENHFDTVYTKDHITNLAFCQSIVYNVLYKDVFKLEEVDYAVNKMLHDKTAKYQKELNAALFCTGFEMRLEMRDNCKNVKDLLDIGITPFPYKVAKSLDPTIYRNVEFDTWNEQRKSVKYGGTVWNNKELQVGSKCYVYISQDDRTVKHLAYIQHMSPDKGPVLVFDEDVGEKIMVPYDSLELIPAPTTQLNSALQRILDSRVRQQLTDKLNNGIEENLNCSSKEASRRKCGRARNDNCNYNKQSRQNNSNERTNEFKLRERNSHKVQQAPIQVSYECKYRDVSVGSDDDSQHGNSPNSNVGFQQQQPVQNQASIVFSVPVDSSGGSPQYIQPVNTTLPCKSITDTMSSLRCAYDYVSEQQQTINGQQQQPINNSSVGYIFVPSYVHNPDVNVSALPRAYGDNGIHSAGIPSQQHNLSTMFIYTPQQGTMQATDKEGSGQLMSSPQHNIILPVSPQSMPPSPVYVNGQQQYIIPIYSNNSAAPPVNFSSPIPGNQQSSTLYVTFPTHQMSNTPPVCFQPIECDGSCMHQSPQPAAYLEAPSPQFLEQPIPIFSTPPHVISAQSQQPLIPMTPGQDMYSVVYPAAPVTSQPSMRQATMYENN